MFTFLHSLMFCTSPPTQHPLVVLLALLVFTFLHSLMFCTSPPFQHPLVLLSAQPHLVGVLRRMPAVAGLILKFMLDLRITLALPIVPLFRLAIIFLVCIFLLVVYTLSLIHHSLALFLLVCGADLMCLPAAVSLRLPGSLTPADATTLSASGSARCKAASKVPIWSCSCGAALLPQAPLAMAAPASAPSRASASSSNCLVSISRLLGSADVLCLATVLVSIFMISFLLVG